ncbi:MAG TPA: long-chain fatty acid--CoA ligase [Steroidobacteraceae bacterium]|nr:long-chain fatty acid--CoA ligase [Steroidobacteraceae bacterium]
MGNAHFKFWPNHALHHLDAPATNLFYNLEVSARRHPAKAALIYYDTVVTFPQLLEEVERLAGYLEQRCGVSKGDRVLLYMQNSPQFVIAYYAILRANAVVVPVNPMYLTQEFLRCAQDAGASCAIVAQELYPRIEPLVGGADLEQVILACYADYLKVPTDLNVPEFIKAPRLTVARAGVVAWADALGADLRPGALRCGPDDLAVMPYTSGTTGEPKGCMHSHRTVMYTAVASMHWFALQPELTSLALAPFFHVTGMQGSMNGPIYNGNTVVLLPRWDRDVAAELVQRYRVSGWTAVPTLIQDFYLNPNIEHYDLSSIRQLHGGGAAMPAAVAQRLLDRGVTYYEGYGLTETMAATHINPLQRAKQQCLGIPIYGVDSRVVDPVTLAELPAGEVGEIVTHGPQVMLGYWNRPEDTARTLIEIDGRKFLRTGDLARVDADGFFFMVDRLKRMINVSGFKVWPSEIETLMYQHPAVLEACVIGAKDAHRGETVKVLIVLRPDYRGHLTAQELIGWCRERMAAYKVPRLVAFVESLPKSGSGKIQWRELQQREMAAASQEQPWT